MRTTPRFLRCGLFLVFSLFTAAESRGQEPAPEPQPLCGAYSLAFAIRHLGLKLPEKDLLVSLKYQPAHGVTLADLENVANDCGAYTLAVRGTARELFPMLDEDTLAINVEPNHYTVLLSETGKLFRVDVSKGTILPFNKVTPEQVFTILLISSEQMRSLDLRTDAGGKRRIFRVLAGGLVIVGGVALGIRGRRRGVGAPPPLQAS